MPMRRWILCIRSCSWVDTERVITMQRRTFMARQTGTYVRTRVHARELGVLIYRCAVLRGRAQWQRNGDMGRRRPHTGRHQPSRSRQRLLATRDHLPAHPIPAVVLHLASHSLSAYSEHHLRQPRPTRLLPFHPNRPRVLPREYQHPHLR